MMQPFIDRFLAENCRCEEVLADRLKRFAMFRQLALMASAGTEVRAGVSGQEDAVSERAVGADEEVRFYFASQVGTEPDKAWFVELTIPAHATVGTSLPIQVGDRVRHRLASGTLAIAGKTLAFTDGKCEIAYEDFLSGLRNPHVAVCREGESCPVGGRLLFF